MIRSEEAELQEDERTYLDSITEDEEPSEIPAAGQNPAGELNNSPGKLEQIVLLRIFTKDTQVVTRRSTSDDDRGQTPEDEAEDEDKTPRTRTSPRTKPRGRG